MDDWRTLCKTYFKIDLYEIQSLAVFTFIFTFISLFHIPEGTGIVIWLFSFIGLYTFLLLLLVGRLCAQKVFSLMQGYTLHYKPFWEGILFTTFMSVLTFGYVFLPLVGSFQTTFLKRQRLGKFFYGHDYYEHALVVCFTTLLTLSIATLLRVFTLYVDWFILEKAVIFLVVLSIMQVLPMPWLEGLQVFFGSRTLYTFLLFFVAMLSICILIPTTLTTILAVVICTFTAVVALLWH